MEAVRDATPAEPETDGLEWKGEWDLGDGEQTFETARHILGFGNRAVIAAAADFEGCAYLLAGVEPSTVFGTPILDPAKIEDKLGRYIEPGRPRWTPHYVEVDGKDVLVIAIEAPRDGDSICTLQKGYGGIREGRIFIRRHGQTEEAKPGEIRALEARSRGTQPRLSLAIERAGETPLQAVSIGKADKEAWFAGERGRLALPPEPPSPRRGPFDFAAAERNRIDRIINGDPRSRKTYAVEVAKYLEIAEGRYNLLFLRQAIERGLAPVALRLLNPSDRNYQGVEVVIEIPTDLAWLDADELSADLKQLEPPEPWGQKRRFDFAAPTVEPLFQASDTIERKEETATVRFGSQHVRPKASIDLPPIYLAIGKGVDELTIRWSLTSTDVNGVQEGEVFFEVAEEPATIGLTVSDPATSANAAG